MQEIINGIIKHGITSETLGAYLEKLKTTLDDAYSAGESDNELAAMVHLGEALTLCDHVQVIWNKMNNK